MLFTRCIFLKPAPEDGFRISIMSRHAKNDGKTFDPHLQSVSLHHSQFGPSPRLIGSYYKRGLSWDQFVQRYLTEMKQPSVAFSIRVLAKCALVSDVTLLCVEETAEYCHRKYLAEEFQRYQPALYVEHR